MIAPPDARRRKRRAPLDQSAGYRILETALIPARECAGGVNTVLRTPAFSSNTQAQRVRRASLPR